MKEPLPVVYNNAYPARVLRRHLHRRVPPLHLLALAAGAGVLRRLPARPDGHAGQAHLGFFNQNLVMEYAHEQAVADGVNVDFEVYRIRTQITAQGSTIEAEPGTMVGYRDRQTRKMRWEAPDEDVTYGAEASTGRRRQGPDPAHRPDVPRQGVHGDVPRPHRGAEDAHLRQGRQPRRGHRRDRPRGVRPGQRLLPEDHLQDDRQRSPPTSSRPSATATTRASPSRWT